MHEAKACRREAGGIFYRTIAQPKTMNLKNLLRNNLPVLAATLALFLNSRMAWAGSQTNSTAGTFTWTAPTNVYSVQVQCWGGGGAGGGGATTGSGSSRSEGGGGGGGAYASNTISVIPGNNYTIVVGAGATSTGNTYTTAGNSTFASTLVVAAGGGNGQGFSTGSTQSGTGGAAGLASASTGAVTFSGGAGENGITGASASNYGGGGGSSAGTNAAGVTSTSITGLGAIAPAGGGNGGSGWGTNNGAGGGRPGFSPGGGGGGANIATATQNGGSGANGQVTLTWVAQPNVTSPTKASITSSTATLGATVTTNGDAPISSYGVVWATTANPTTANNEVQAGTTVTTPNTFTTPVSGLPAGTLIYYGGYAINSAGTSYSPYDSFYTLSTVPSSQASGLSATPASTTSIGLTWSAGTGASGYLIVQVESSTAPNGVPAAATAYTAGQSIGTDGGTVAAIVTPGSATSATITGLTPTTTYSFAIYAFAWDGSHAATYDYLTTAVSTAQATTLTAPAISVSPSSLSFPPTAVGNSSLPLTYTVSGANLTGNIVISAPANFAISTTSGSGYGSSVTLAQSGGTVSATTIYVVFSPTAQTTYSANITHASFGANNPNVAVSGVGASAPSVTTSAATSLTTAGATFNGSVTSSNGAVLTDSGFYYQTTPGVTTSGTQVDVGSTSLGAISKAVTGLNPNQIYYYRAYAVNAAGTGLGATDVSFYTLANTPTAPTVSSPTQTSVNVAIGSGDGNPVATPYAIFETVTGKYVQVNGVLGNSPVFLKASIWGSETVTGLSPNSAYIFQVAAQNEANVTTAFGPATPANTAASPFTAGNLAVLSPNNGSASQTTCAVLEITTNLNQVNPVQTININGTVGNPGTALRIGTSATSGGLATSSDGTLLCVAGYNTTNTTGANTVLRGVGTLNGAGVFNMPATYSGNGVAGNQTRCATTVDDQLFYWADKGGVYTNGTTSPTDGQNILRVRSFGGTVYEINQQGFASVVSTVSQDGTTLYPLPNYPTATDKNANDFYLISSGQNGAVYDILYQLDASATNAGTIYKYSLVNGQWLNNSSYNTSFGGCSIIAANTATGAVLYVVTTLGTTDNNSVIELTDGAGYNANIQITTVGTLYTAPGSSSLKSIAFVPLSYTVTYSGNNATSGTPPTDNNSYGLDALVTVLGNTGNLVKTGYTFSGWNTAANGGGTNLGAGVSFTITSNTTLYAQWTLIDTPMTNTAECSTSVSYTWTPTGSAPFSYQWYFGSTLLSGQTAATLSLPGVGSANSGDYYVVFGNSATTTSNLVAVLTVVDTQPPVLSLPANITVQTGSGGVAVTYNPTATDSCSGSVPVICSPASGSFFAPGTTLVNCTANDSDGYSTSGSFTVTVIDTNATTNIVVNGTIYLPYATNLPVGTWVWLDGTPSLSKLRASQRLLGYWEVAEKAVNFAGLFFTNVTPTTNGAAITYNYSAQNGKSTDTIGQLADKFSPMIIGPDGNGYMTDDHHTVAAYLQTNSPIYNIIPGVQRVVLGQVQINQSGSGLQINDAWWLANQSANNAYLYGVNGDQLLLPTDPNYSNSLPILPYADNSPMPASPSEFPADGTQAMSNDPYRSVGWGIRQGILPTAYTSGGSAIGGYANTDQYGNGINFVDFYWGDFLRNRLVWNNNLTATGNGDSNVINAPLSFFAASATGIALCKSELYTDQNGRSLFSYTNSSVWTNTNTTYWASSAIANGLAAPGDTYNMFLRDDSTVVGSIIPSAFSTNILHVDTYTNMVLTQFMSNIYSLFLNAGAVVTTTFPDAQVPNSILTFPAGTAEVSLNSTAWVTDLTALSNGTFAVNGTLNCPNVNVIHGVLAGAGTINGAVQVQNVGTFAPGNAVGTLTINGALTLAGATVMQITNIGSTLSNSSVAGVTTVTYGGTLTVTANGATLAYGDTFTLFSANSYTGSFSATNLPALGSGLIWNTSQLGVNGTITVSNTRPLLTVTASNASRIFGQPNPVFQGSITGLQNGDDITALFNCSATTNSPVGSYSIVPSLNDPLDLETNYTVYLVDGTLTVQQASVTVSWAPPAAINYGTPLSSAQLNATASVPGTFNYNPPSGTILNPGTNLLSVIFTPSDAVDYAGGTAMVNLVVNNSPASEGVGEPLLPGWGGAALLAGLAVFGAIFVTRRTTSAG
jgi:uncharacterized repeat protein (TIGR02543 family)